MVDRTIHARSRSSAFAYSSCRRTPRMESPRRKSRSSAGRRYAVEFFCKLLSGMTQYPLNWLSINSEVTCVSRSDEHRRIIHLQCPLSRVARFVHMFNPTLIVIEAFIRELRAMYERTYGTMEPGYPGVISFVAQLALENIATSDAAYHDVHHTIMVTLVGQEILRGRHISVGGVTPRDWLHFIISLLCHDIGYVRGICRGDGDGSYVTNLTGDKATLPEGATNA